MSNAGIATLRLYLKKLFGEWLALESSTAYLVSIWHCRRCHLANHRVFLLHPMFCCVFMCACVYIGVCIPMEGMAGIRGSWKEEGKWERGNEIQKASARCRWQSTSIPSAGFGAGGGLKSGWGEGAPFDQGTPFTLAVPSISPPICFVSSGDQESQCHRHSFGSH